MKTKNYVKMVAALLLMIAAMVAGFVAGAYNVLTTAEVSVKGQSVEIVYRGNLWVHEVE